MISKKYLLIGFIVLNVLVSSAHALFEKKVQIVEPAVQDQINKKMINGNIAIIPQLNKITSGFSEIDSKKFYFTKTHDKIFYQDKKTNAQIKLIDYKNDRIIFHLHNDLLGKGTVSIIFIPETSGQLSLIDIEKALESVLSLHENLKVTASTTSKTFHLHTSNHLPDADKSEQLSISEALSKGYNPCGFCFVKESYIPDHRLEQTLARKGTAEIRSMIPLAADQPSQDYLKKAGNMVLEKWPVPFIGYDYKFQVIDDAKPDAFALPTGLILVTSGLLRSVESEEELEAVLAREIAHVERRHALRIYYKEVEDKGAQAAIVALASGLSGSAAEQQATEDPIGVSLVASIVTDVYFSGYPVEFQREADDMAMLYFEKNKMDKGRLENIFRKNQFMNFAADTDSGSGYQDFEKRTARIRQAGMQIFKANHFVSLDNINRAPVQIDLLYEINFNDTSYISAYIDDYDILNLTTEGYASRGNSKCKNKYLNISDESGQKRFHITKDSTIRDSWGAYILVNEVKTTMTTNIKKVSLIIERDKELTNQESWGFSSCNIEEIAFKEGTID